MINDIVYYAIKTFLFVIEICSDEKDYGKNAFNGFIYASALFFFGGGIKMDLLNNIKWFMKAVLNV